jgi:hypothetical protein
VKKAEQIKKKDLKEKKVIEKYIEPEPETESDSEPEIIIQKVKKTKPRKKVIVIQQEESEDEVKPVVNYRQMVRFV